jgi:hypothetical protein
MKSTRRTAIVVGALFISGYVGVFVAEAISSPVLNAPDYLTSVYPNRLKVIMGVLVELLLNDVPVVGIGVLLFPILKKYGEGIALWYAATRVIEAVTLVVSKISTLSLITLSQAYVSAGTPDVSHFQTSGALAFAGRYWAFDVINTIFFIIGAVILYSMLYKSKLVPRFISVWGLIAVAALTAANLIGVPDLTQGFNPGQLLYFPIMTSELLLAVWLIAKGFNPSADYTPSSPGR